MAASPTARRAAALRARRVKEIILEVEDQPGKLAQVLQALADGGVNLLAYSALTLTNTGVLHLIPDRPARAQRVVQQLGAVKISVSDIVYVVGADRPGGGAALTRKISDAGINIHYSYATSAGGPRYGAVYQTADNAKAVRALNRR